MTASQEASAVRRSDRGPPRCPGPQCAAPVRRRPISATSIAEATRPRARGPATEKDREEGQLGGEPPRSGQLVVGLAHPLLPEAADRRGSTGHDEVEQHPGLTAGFDRPHELEVLEQHITRVALSEQRAPHDHSSRPVAPQGTVHELAARVPPRVPRHGNEEGLRDHRVTPVQEVEGASSHGWSQRTSSSAITTISWRGRPSRSGLLPPSRSACRRQAGGGGRQVATRRHALEHPRAESTTTTSATSAATTEVVDKVIVAHLGLMGARTTRRRQGQSRRS